MFCINVFFLCNFIFSQFITYKYILIFQTVMNYSRFINELSSLRKPSIIREFGESRVTFGFISFALVPAKFLTKDDKDLIFLAGGVPNPSAFPFLDSQVRLRTGEILQLDEKQLELGLQYGPTPG